MLSQPFSVDFHPFPIFPTLSPLLSCFFFWPLSGCTLLAPQIEFTQQEELNSTQVVFGSSFSSFGEKFSTCFSCLFFTIFHFSIEKHISPLSVFICRLFSIFPTFHFHVVLFFFELFYFVLPLFLFEKCSITQPERGASLLHDTNSVAEYGAPATGVSWKTPAPGADLHLLPPAQRKLLRPNQWRKRLPSPPQRLLPRTLHQRSCHMLSPTQHLLRRPHPHSASHRVRESSTSCHQRDRQAWCRLSSACFLLPPIRRQFLCWTIWPKHIHAVAIQFVLVITDHVSILRSYRFSSSTRCSAGRIAFFLRSLWRKLIR